MSLYRGRFAPSPTGPLHFGSLVAALGSWLDARAAGGEWLLRIEDVDTTRSQPDAADRILGALEALGLTWDGEVLWQSRRTRRYEEALAQLRASGHVYCCRCSRREIQDSASWGADGAIYPGTCRELGLQGDALAERLRVPPGTFRFPDRLQGPISQDLRGELGDFVLRRRDGLHAYQLAVVVDDADQGVTDVVRGADLLWSTPRQIALQSLLGFPTPRYLHLPVATNAAGEKLSKQTHAPAIDAADAETVLRQALVFLGQAIPDADRHELLNAAVAAWEPARIPLRAAVTTGDGRGRPAA